MVYCIQWTLVEDKEKHKYFGPPLYSGSLEKTPFSKKEADTLAERADKYFKKAEHVAVLSGKKNNISLRT